MAEPLIRAAASEDTAALRDLYRRASLSNEGDRESLLAHPEALEFTGLPVDEGRTRVAVVDGRIVGFATLLAGELEDLFVDPGWMRRGIGRALVLDAAAVARGQGLQRIDVIANDHALGFYESLGFVRDGPAETAFGRGSRMHLAC
ncbi:MAG: N-acetyltransferase family protein [Gaiellaceae bacterium]